MLLFLGHRLPMSGAFQEFCVLSFIDGVSPKAQLVEAHFESQIASCMW